MTSGAAKGPICGSGRVGWEGRDRLLYYLVKGLAAKTKARCCSKDSTWAEQVGIERSRIKMAQSQRGMHSSAGSKCWVGEWARGWVGR